MTYVSDGEFVADGWYGNVDAYCDYGSDFDDDDKTMIMVMAVTTMTMIMGAVIKMITILSLNEDDYGDCNDDDDDDDDDDDHNDNDDDDDDDDDEKRRLR